MTKDAKLLSLCMTVMLSAPFSGMAQPKGYRQDAPFPPVNHIIQVRQTPPVKKDGMTKGNQSTVVRPAWTAQLNDENVFHLFTVIDNNKDDATWIFFKDGYGSGNTCYKYNAQEAADDWLISPYIELKAGTNYNIRFHARANSSYYKETLKVCVGTEPTVAGMAAGQVILPSTEIGGDTVSFSKTFTPVTDGNYCIGFHAETEADHNRLYLYDLTIEEGAVNAAPDAPTALSATADETGEPRATLSFLLPLKAVDGTTLNTIDSVLISRNGERLTALTGVFPGSRQTYEDNHVVLNGNNTYTIAAYAGKNKGKEAAATVFVGVDTPQMPQALVIKDNKTTVGAAWSKVTEGANHGRINPERIVYKVFAFDEQNRPTIPVKEVTGKTETQIEVNTGEGPQRLLQYAVAASNAGGQSDFVYSNAFVAGAPEVLPFRESFSVDDQSAFNHFWWMDGEGSGYGYGLSTVAFDRSSYDGDGSCIKFNSVAYNDKLNFKTGKIKLENSDRLKAVFSYRSDEAKFARFNLMAVMPDGNALPLKSYSLAEATEWTPVQVDLPSYLGLLDHVMLQFQLEATGSPDVPQTLYIDNVNIAVASGKDIAISLGLPGKAQRGKKTSLKLKVRNYGSDEAKGYTVTVKAADELILNTKVEEVLPPFSNRDIEVPFTPNILHAGEQLQITAEISMDGDEKTENNTASGSVKLYDYKGAPVAGLTGIPTSEGVRLSWNAPEAVNETFTETFEDYQPWIIDHIGEWTVVDNDREVVGSLFNDLQLPHEHEKYAFMVTNFEQDYQAGSYFPGHSGYTFLSSIYCINSDGTEHRPNDNWLISPDLSGNAQTVTFHARNHDGSDILFPENIHVLYSTTDTRLESFKPAGSYVADKGEWQEFSARLPEGALFFAIRSKNEAGKSNWLALDDITFERGTGNVAGYNIYRDGTFLAMIKDVTAFTDRSVQNGEHRYQVTAVYANGNESAPATVIVTVTTDINRPMANGGHPADIYDISGRLVRKNATSAEGLKRGIHIAGNKKFVVK